MRIAFVGNGETGMSCLIYLLVTKCEVSSVSSKNRLIRWIAKILKIPVVRNLKRIMVHKPDVLLSVYYHKKIPKKVLNNVKAYNFHGGILPNYKGCFSNIWSIINDEKYAGSTVHTMTEEFDEGNILDIKKFKIKKYDTGGSVFHKTEMTTIKLFRKFVHNLLKNRKFKVIGNAKGGKYYKRELPNNGEIDLSWSKRKIYNFIRALHFPPYEGAYLKVGKEKIGVNIK